MPKLSTQVKTIGELSALRPLGAVFMGDSITATRSYPSYFCQATRGAVRMLKNAGIGGQTTTQMLSRFNADVLALSPDFCFIMGGINDIITGQPITTPISNILSMVDQCLANGIVPVVLPNAPENNYFAQVADYNYLLMRKASDRGALVFSPWDAYIARGGNYTWLAGSNDDNTHPTYATTVAWAQALAGQFLGTTQRNDIWGPFCSQPNGSMFSNGFFVTDTNADGRADGVDRYSINAGIEAASTYSIIDNPVSIGKAQKLVLVGAPATPSAGLRMRTTSNLVVGDLYDFTVDAKTEDFSNAKLQITFYLNGVNHFLDWAFDRTGSLNGPAHYRFRAAEGITTAECRLVSSAIDGVNPYNATMIVGRLALVNLTELGLDA
jgi:lysophospholipase L1-like esterase